MHFDEILLKKEGVTADISLEQDRIDQPFGVDFYLWLPVQDHQAPIMDQLEVGVAMIEKLVSLKRKVYIHCKNGHGRAPTLVAAYLIKNLGKSLEGAERFLKEKRVGVHLSADQATALKNYSKSLMASR
jgi:protein-tyrosine phosphatase